MQPSQQFTAAGDYWLSCNACPRAPVDCGTDRTKLAAKARSAGYKLTPGLGWICNDCWWAIETEVRVTGTIETITH